MTRKKETKFAKQRRTSSGRSGMGKSGYDDRVEGKEEVTEITLGIDQDMF